MLSKIAFHTTILKLGAAEKWRGVGIIWKGRSLQERSSRTKMLLAVPVFILAYQEAIDICDISRDYHAYRGLNMNP